MVERATSSADGRYVGTTDGGPVEGAELVDVLWRDEHAHVHRTRAS